MCGQQDIHALEFGHFFTAQILEREIKYQLTALLNVCVKDFVADFSKTAIISDQNSTNDLLLAPYIETMAVCKISSGCFLSTIYSSKKN